ncbi:hypothetical protein ACFP3U_13750 [Kitasatospora misakiensis]|uniref:AbiEi antitoxin C-terminal domain-containing protein n=1 Tax=Kitasatospora misakiensis TaxID=67330 RepID=A0ABW0X4G3_9ACTN
MIRATPLSGPPLLVEPRPLVGPRPLAAPRPLVDPLLLVGADQQHIVTRAQLRGLGVPSGTIAHRLRPGGPWQRVLPRVICLQTGRLTAHQRLRAALAYAGPKGRPAPEAGEVLLTGAAVLADAGLPSAGHPADLAEVDVLIPGQRRVADRGFVRIHRAGGAMPGGFERDDGLWSTSVARALADLAPRERADGAGSARSAPRPSSGGTANSVSCSTSCSPGRTPARCPGWPGWWRS